MPTQLKVVKGKTSLEDPISAQAVSAGACAYYMFHLRQRPGIADFSSGRPYIGQLTSIRQHEYIAALAKPGLKVVLTEEELPAEGLARWDVGVMLELKQITVSCLQRAL